MSKKFFKIFFILVFLLGAALRLYSISDVPPGVNQDEASIGYTAYSLLKTGKDEYGIPFPLSFQSFGDWKLPVYIYLTVPFVKILGLSEVAVRLPSVIFGSITILLTYFLTKYLFKNKTIALLAMATVAISPWHLHLSRVESEANVAVFLTVLSTILLFKSFEKRKWLIIPSAIGFVLTYYTYAGNYIFTTLFLLVIFSLYKKQLLFNRFLKIGIVLFFTLFFLIFSQTVFSANKTKLSGIGIFSDPAIFSTKIESPRNDHKNQALAKVLHNKIILGAERFVQNYLNSYSPEFLFVKGGENKAHNISNFGNMYLIEAPFLLLGVITLFIRRKKTESKFLILWLLLAPIASSITKDAPHTNRMFSVFPALPIIVALGIYEFSQYFRLKKILFIAFLTVCLLSITIYLDRYFVHFPRNEAQNWGLPYKTLLNKINEDKYNDRKIIFARPEVSHYIFLLFYSDFDPLMYQNSVVRYPPTSDKFVHVNKFDRYEFRDIVWSKDIKSKRKLLLIDFSKDIPPFIKDEHYIFSEIKLPNQKPIFTIVESKPELKNR